MSIKKLISILLTPIIIVVGFIAITLIWIFVGVGGVIIAKIIEGLWYALNEMTVMFISLFATIGLWVISVEKRLRRKK